MVEKIIAEPVSNSVVEGLRNEFVILPSSKISMGGRKSVRQSGIC